MRNSIKSLKNYFQLIVTAVTCFVMRFIKDKENVSPGGCEGHAVKRTGFLGRLWKHLVVSLVCETPKAKVISEYIVKDTDTKKSKTDLYPKDKKNSRKNKIIYWNEPRIQNRISKAAYFNTG